MDQPQTLPSGPAIVRVLLAMGFAESMPQMPLVWAGFAATTLEG
jgi:hypothetical protein